MFYIDGIWTALVSLFTGNIVFKNEELTNNQEYHGSITIIIIIEIWVELKNLFMIFIL